MALVVNIYFLIFTTRQWSGESNVFSLRDRLHQASASTLRPLCDDASDSVLIEINGDA